MLLSGANTLLLDEPTNHLDLASRRTLEAAMLGFPGTLVFVSHDRVFLERVPTRIVEVKDGGLRSFPGNYTDYSQALADRGEASPLVGHGGGRTSGAGARSQTDPAGSTLIAGSSDAPALTREQKKALQRDQRKIEREIADLESQIAQTEEQIKQIDRQLITPSVYTDPQRAGGLAAEHKRLRDGLARLYEQWEKRTERLRRM
jgi:ATP-binding cassette subfamily F protein 3